MWVIKKLISHLRFDLRIRNGPLIFRTEPLFAPQNLCTDKKTPAEDLQVLMVVARERLELSTS